MGDYEFLILDKHVESETPLPFLALPLLVALHKEIGGAAATEACAGKVQLDVAQTIRLIWENTADFVPVRADALNTRQQPACLIEYGRLLRIEIVSLQLPVWHGSR